MGVCVCMPGQAAPPPTSQHRCNAPLTSSSVTEKTGVIDQSHQGDGGPDSSACTAGGTLARFLRLSCRSEALHLLEQSRESSCSLLYEPVVLTGAQRSLWLCHRDILFRWPDPGTIPTQNGEVVGRRREDCTKQINNVMSSSHRNSILAAALLL